MRVRGYFWFLLGEYVALVCYPGDVFAFRNQSKTTINANNRIAAGLSAFKNAVKAPSFALAA